MPNTKERWHNFGDVLIRPGQVLNWVCRDNLSYLDLTENRLEMDPD
jgi:hypothetical protein